MVEHGTFLKPVSLREARELAKSNFYIPPRVRYIELENSLGWVLTEDIISPVDVPPEDRSFYDGFALRSSDVASATPDRPAVLKISLKGYVERGAAKPVGAGEPIPDGADCVARAEICSMGGDEVAVRAPVRGGENVIRRGSDLRKGDVALRRGTVLRPQDVALAMDLGFRTVKVYERPRVAVVHVGEEVRRKKAKGFPYPESFSRMASLLLRSFGFEASHLGIFPEDASVLKEVLLSAAESFDSIAVVGRASIGEGDIVPKVVSEVGKVVFHGVTVSPGKVSGMAVVNGKPVFIVPAHVGSAMASLLLIVIPALSKSFYGREDPYLKLRARLKGRIDGRPGLTVFRTVLLRKEWGEFVAYPASKEYGGSPFLTSLTKANGFILLDPGRSLMENEHAEVSLFSPAEALPLSLGLWEDERL